MRFKISFIINKDDQTKCNKIFKTGDHFYGGRVDVCMGVCVYICKHVLLFFLLMSMYYSSKVVHLYFRVIRLYIKTSNAFFVSNFGITYNPILINFITDSF